MEVSTDNGSTWKVLTYKSVAIGSETAGTPSIGTQVSSTNILLSQDNLDSAAGQGWSGWIDIYLPVGSTTYTGVRFDGQYTSNTTDDAFVCWGGGAYESTTDVTAIRFLMSSGNLTTGTFTLYGVSES